MKLWRKQAKKDPVTGNRNGRQIRYQSFVSEQVLKYQPKSYPLLDALIEKSGITFVMSKKEQAKLEELIASANKETTDETV